MFKNYFLHFKTTFNSIVLCKLNLFQYNSCHYDQMCITG